MAMLNIVMVQVNNYQGRGIEYANRLADQVRANLTVRHRIHCITDEAASEYYRVRCHPHDKALPGWWQKIRLFHPGLFKDGERMLFLDLDTIIVRNIDFLAEFSSDFAILHDFWRPAGLGPAVMLWRAGYGGEIWQSFVDAGMPMKDPRGDQWWLEQHFTRRPPILQELYPDAFVSYKTHATQGIPREAHVVCFHGKPRPHECGGWVKDYWS
jgi:hypothetical protein